MRIFGFPEDIVLSSLILCIRNFDLVMKKEDKIITYTKYIALQFYHIACFTRFYGHVSLACY